jgi:hypothetical protein
MFFLEFSLDFLERKSTSFYFLFMQLSSRSKLRKEACALWQVLFSFARCPASRQLGIGEKRKSSVRKKQCLKQTFQRLQLAAHTTD